MMISDEIVTQAAEDYAEEHLLTLDGVRWFDVEEIRHIIINAFKAGATWYG